MLHLTEYFQNQKSGNSDRRVSSIEPATEIRKSLYKDIEKIKNGVSNLVGIGPIGCILSVITMV